MSKRKIEVKVNMHSQKCKTEVLKAVTKVAGIDQVSVELGKQMLVVIGDVDPISIVTRVRKIGKRADITYVGPVKKPDNTKPCINPCQIMYPPPACNDLCPMVVVGYPQSCDNGSCFIL
ncbi:hypothetical protein LXL04_033723 [Taraxacum kok-saghyz]